MSHQMQPAAFITTQPMAAGNPFKQLNGQWNVGFCDCCSDMKQCLFAYCCWPCFVCSLAGKLGEPCCSACCVPSALAIYRMKVRAVFRIEGDSCNDYCATCCCPFCSALQMANELSARGIPQ